MKKVTKRLLALLLVCSMAVGMLAACGEKTGPETGTTEAPTTAGTTQSATEAPTEAAGIDMSETIKYTLKVCTTSDHGDWNDMWIFEQLEERFNIDLEIEMINNDVWNEKVPLWFTGDDLPDVFLSGLDDTYVGIYGEQGYFLPLEDMISQELTPNIYKMVQENPDLLKACTELDGHIYALRGLDVSQALTFAEQRCYINEKWAMQVLGKIPETVEEFYEYLKGVKEQDVDGDGDPNNEIPLGGRYLNSTTHVRDAMSMVMYGYGITHSMRQVDDNGDVVFTPAMENYKELLKYMNKLYEEKLLDNDYFTQTKQEFQAKDSENLYGAFSEWAPSYSGRTLEEAIEYGYVMFEPLTSEFNDEKLWPAYDMKRVGEIVINSECENPERLLMALDWLLSEEVSIAYAYGWEKDTNPEYPGYGHVAEWNGNELTVRWEGPNGPDDVVEGYETQGQFRLNQIGPNFEKLPVYKAYTLVPEEGTLDAWFKEELQKVQPYFTVSYPSGVKFTAEENNELSLLETDLRSYKAEMETKMITGELDIDATWDSWIEGLEARGMSRYVEIYQTAYDRYMGN